MKPLLLALVFLLSACSINAAELGGVYVFRPATGPVVFPAALLNNKSITGFVIRDTWANIQPSSSRPPNFSRLLAACKELDRLGKRYHVEIFGGEVAPAWTGGVNAQYSEAYVKLYETFVAQQGVALKDCKGLVAVHCCLPMRSSPEFVLERTKLGVANWQTLALNSNGRGLVAHAKAFPPSVAIVIDLHNPSGNERDGYVEKQVEQAKRLIGSRLCVQENAWNAKAGQKTYNLFQTVSLFSRENRPCGLEQVSVSSNRERYGDSFAASMQYAKQANPTYLIIYEGDVKYVTTPYKKS